MNIQNYLFFDGNCAEAMHFYEETLGGKLFLMKGSEAPDRDQMPPGTGNLVLHARLEVAGGAALMASDWFAPDPYPGARGFSVSLGSLATEEAKALFEKLSTGGQVTMPFGKTFYSDGFGMLVDRFGIPWMVMSATSTVD